jgi:hypothetical protein
MTEWAHCELVEENSNQAGGREEYDLWADTPSRTAGWGSNGSGVSKWLSSIQAFAVETARTRNPYDPQAVVTCARSTPNEMSSGPSDRGNWS